MARTGFMLLVLMTLLVGGAYPLFITLIGQHFFPYEAEGSLLKNSKGEPIGSSLIAQKFKDLHYFWPRPSASDYQTLPSSGSNLGPTSKVLQAKIKERTEKLNKDNSDVAGKIPVDLLYASGSGLDPHISFSASQFQIARVSKARGIEVEKLNSIINQLALRNVWESPFHYLNVLQINYELDQQYPIRHDTTKPTVEQPKP